MAKYTADSNGNGIPQRAQSMHDNLLGNLSIAALQDRFSGDKLQELLDLIPDEYETRPYYDGNEARVGGAIHDAVRAFDYDKGWDRPDYIEHSFGAVDVLAQDTGGVWHGGDTADGDMRYGQGNSTTDWNLVRHEGAGVELALKAKEFGPNGGDYSSAEVEVVDGVAHYNVSTGVSPDHASRADWSFDYAATVLPHGTDDAFKFKLKIDTDASEGVNLVEIPTTVYGGLVQGSSNIGFSFILSGIDSDPTTDGIQAYVYGEGEFDVVLEAYTDTGTLIAENHIVVHVGGMGWDFA